MRFDRKIFFDSVRPTLFHGSMKQQQVDGMNFKLAAFEERASEGTDLRWPAYCFATSYHETAATMWPIEEYGKGKGMEYGVPDPTTGQVYYGRGDVQLTWADNYKFATEKLGLTGTADDLYWHASKALDPTISARVMMRGMRDGWFRKDKYGPHKLERYFDDKTDDPFQAREIINGDKYKVPDWSGGFTIGDLIAGYHKNFLTAFQKSLVKPAPPPVQVPTIQVTGNVIIIYNGEQITMKS